MPTTPSGLFTRAVEPLHALGDLSLVKVKHRRAARYILAADVAEYYRSLYTHSIPWALHGKDFAKREQRNNRLFGNRLDIALRNMQDKQTNGIPIGPDTSLIIGEVILSAVDARLLEFLGPLTGYRYYDDYELSFVHHSEAEEALRALQTALAEYNLQLNPLKTRIIELPQTIELPWVLEFRDFDFQNRSPQSKQRIIRFFDKAFEYRERYKDSHILSYAVGRVDRVMWSPAEWEVVQDLLFQAVSIEPSAAQPFVSALIKAKVRMQQVDMDGIGKVLNQILELNAAPGNSSEAVWALYGLLAFGLKLTAQAAASVAKCSDVFVALLALDARSRGLVEGDLDVNRWAAMLTRQELYRSHWLLAYEASVRGWLPTAGRGDHVQNDPFFGQLKSANVSFYVPVEQPSEEVVERLKTRKAKSYGDSSDDDDSDDDDSDDDDSDDDDSDDDDSNYDDSEDL